MSIRLAVGLPAYRSVVAAQQAKMWMEFGGYIARNKPMIDLVMVGAVDVCGIDRARNLIVAHAMKESADWVLMVDSDTWCADGNELVRMIVEAPEGAAMVGASVRTRGGGRGELAPLNMYRWNSEESRHEPIHVQWTNGTYQEIDAVGGAVIAINLHRLQPADIFKWHYYETGQSISEDLYFCRKLRERGEKVYVDTRVKTFHVDRAQVLSNG